MKAQLTPLRRLKWNRICSKSQVEVGYKLVPSHTIWADLIIEVDGDLRAPSSCDIEKMINSGATRLR